ncbi:MAG: rod shape-determining protein [Deltaproteobacteria bacterium]|nr:rod shape-determining protein [Deltaproteobacteria bacterium]MBW2050876.1 rod shape-determining protein [Deltaproteobacteria bacterium]MBW2141718.1 rod shape-determining protein [Deltaproteobacteria bacterium]MBW2322875.1 rod shape-determining protein [Deltaproteobacteria bacterium]
MFFNKLFGFFSKDLAMDLGTANTLIYQKGNGVVLNEPSVVALSRDSGKLLAVGQEAKEFLGRTPKKIEAVRPMKDGVIADFKVTQEMIKYFLTKVQGSRLIHPRIVIGVPTGITQVEKRAVIEAAESAGTRSVHLIDEPMAAAIGANLNIEEPYGRMVVDIGGGTTEVAVISLSAIAYSESIRVAGDEANDAIVRYLQKKFQLLIGENSAEQAKINIGNAFPKEAPPTYDIAGKDIVSGRPKVVTITEKEMRSALAEPIQAILQAIRRALEKTPPELASDIHDSGITLAGGGALLKGLDKLIAHYTKLEVNITEDPLKSVVLGTGIAVENMNTYQKVFIN